MFVCVILYIKVPNALQVEFLADLLGFPLVRRLKPLPPSPCCIIRSFSVLFQLQLLESVVMST